MPGKPSIVKDKECYLKTKALNGSEIRLEAILAILECGTTSSRSRPQYGVYEDVH